MRRIILVIGAAAVLPALITTDADAIIHRPCRTIACDKRVAAHHQRARCASRSCKRRTCRSSGCVARIAARRRAHVVAPYRPWLEATARCESGGNYRAVSPNGRYRGRYQFDQQSWESAGGRGDPAAAPPGEQDYRAVVWRRMAGTGAWPVCGH